jgi:protein-S-isoprenylcysteine O-methyltransferase Ste14
MRKLQVMLRVVVVLLLLGWAGSFLPRSMAQTNSNQPIAVQASPSTLSTITSAVSSLWQKMVSWLINDARTDQATTHVVQTSG